MLALLSSSLCSHWLLLLLRHFLRMYAGEFFLDGYEIDTVAIFQVLKGAMLPLSPGYFMLDFFFVTYQHVVCELRAIL